jgi:hypothetical protein
MRYQYLFCASCGMRRFGHGLRCTVCDSLLRRPGVARPVRPSLPLSLEPLVRGWRDQPEAASTPARQAIAA